MRGFLNLLLMKEALPVSISQEASQPIRFKVGEELRFSRNHIDFKNWFGLIMGKMIWNYQDLPSSNWHICIFDGDFHLHAEESGHILVNLLTSKQFGEETLTQNLMPSLEEATLFIFIFLKKTKVEVNEIAAKEKAIEPNDIIAELSK